MTNKTIEPPTATTVPTPLRRLKFGEILRTTTTNIKISSSQPQLMISSSDDGSTTSSSSHNSTATPPSPTTSSPRLSFSDGLGAGSTAESLHQSSCSSEYSPNNNNNNNNYIMSPWNQLPNSPYIKSPWKLIKRSPNYSPLQQQQQQQQQQYLHNQQLQENYKCCRTSGVLIGSLHREEGHVYSLAACGEMLYTGSDSKNIRVWKNLKDVGGFKSSSGLVKAIIISPAAASAAKGGGSISGNNNNKMVFTGHQDGKIRVWKTSTSGGAGWSSSSSSACSSTCRRIGSLPTVKDYLKSSMNPRKYVKVRRNRKVPSVRHFDAVSCLCLNPESGLLYSGSWDKTIKVWRLSDSKCLESIPAHDDAINSIAVSIADGLVFSGSADGTVKVWRQELNGNNTSHLYVQTLLSQESAITSLAISGKDSRTVYCGSSDGLVNFWERDKCWLSYGGVLRGHKLAVLCLATAAGGSLVVSGSADKSICVWKREDTSHDGGIHSCVSVLTGHSGPVKCLAVEEHHADEGDEGLDDDRDHGTSWIVYSGSLDKSVKVWRVST